MNETKTPFQVDHRLVRKLGRFKISQELLRTKPDVIRDALFSKVVVVEATMRWESHCVEYVAMSELFEELPEHVQAPTYEFVFRDMNGATLLTEVTKA
jgi:hypothetical protein